MLPTALCFSDLSVNLDQVRLDFFSNSRMAMGVLYWYYAYFQFFES